MAKYLFFHYGPGGNCSIERAWLSNKYPQIEFWDQPSAQTFLELKNACARKLKDTFKDGQPAHVIGHSFGCDLAMAVISDENMKVDSLTLIAPIYDLYDAFLNLSSRIQKQSDLLPEQKNQMAQAADLLSKQKSTDRLWPLIGLMAQYPNFPAVYWKSQDVFNKYQAALTQAKGLDFGMWQAVLNDYLLNHKLKTDIKCQNLKIIFGSDDPYQNISTSTDIWKKTLSSAKMETLNCGHYPHLESDKIQLV